MSNLPAILTDQAATQEEVRSYCKRLIDYYNDQGLTGAAANSFVVHIHKYVQKKAIKGPHLNLIYVWVLENYPRQYRTAPGIDAINKGYNATQFQANSKKVAEHHDVEWVPELSNVLSEYFALREKGFTDAQIDKDKLIGGQDE